MFSNPVSVVAAVSRHTLRQAMESISCFVSEATHGAGCFAQHSRCSCMIQGANLINFSA